jgi:hypothetical protein
MLENMESYMERLAIYLKKREWSQIMNKIIAVRGY